MTHLKGKWVVFNLDFHKIKKIPNSLEEKGFLIFFQHLRREILLRKNAYIYLFLLAGLISLNLEAYLGDLSQTIYGEDDREEALNIPFNSQMTRSFPSVALILEKSQIGETVCSRYKNLETYSLEGRDFCAQERFRAQRSAGFCTGFLVSPDMLITAGHCLESRESCKDLMFLFDYKEEKKRVLTRNLRACEKVLFLGEGEASENVDLAIIKLTKKVEGRPFLVLEEKKKEPLDVDFFVPGHPLGMPLKVVTSGFILENSKEKTFTAAIDTYKGNSGSPVINKKTGLVEGMLTRGGNDFELRGDCYRSVRCLGSICLGEEVLRSSSIKNILNSLVHSSF